MQDSEYAPHPISPDVTAFVLTGGKSERMGKDKALLPLASGATLLEHALAVASAVAGQIGIIGPRERYAAYAWAGEIIEDIFPQQGPLAGIHAALSVSKTEWNIVLAVDLPRVTPELLRWMLGEARKSGKQVTVASVSGGLHPLCGVYRRDFRQRAEAGLREGWNKVAANFDPASTRTLTEDEVRTAGFEPELFQNVNTPEEFQKLSAGK
ncbi:MAG TPA: molybdenum cofactor guanylyltransferase [Terriglobales bacterium]